MFYTLVITPATRGQPSVALNYHGVRAVGTLLGEDNYGPWSGKVGAALIVSRVWSIVNKARVRPRARPNVVRNGDQTIVINLAAIDRATKFLADFVDEYKKSYSVIINDTEYHTIKPIMEDLVATWDKLAENL